MDKHVKHRWTKESAFAYIGLVNGNKAPLGLKYCSALDYLNRYGWPAVSEE